MAGADTLRLNISEQSRSVEVKTFIYKYDYNPQEERVRIICDGQRYVKSVLSWEPRQSGDTAWVFTLRDMETVELSDGKITPISNPFTYVLEVNSAGQLLRIGDPEYCIESHLIDAGHDAESVPKHLKMLLLQEIHKKVKRIWDGFLENWVGISPLDHSTVTNMEVINEHDVYSFQSYMKEEPEKIQQHITSRIDDEAFKAKMDKNSIMRLKSKWGELSSKNDDDDGTNIKLKLKTDLE